MGPSVGTATNCLYGIFFNEMKILLFTYYLEILLGPVSQVPYKVLLRKFPIKLSGIGENGTCPSI